MTESMSSPCIPTDTLISMCWGRSATNGGEGGREEREGRRGRKERKGGEGGRRGREREGGEVGYEIVKPHLHKYSLKISHTNP